MFGKLVGFLYLANVIFLSAALNWTKKQYTENCTCAQNWQLQFMNKYFIIAILFNLFGFFSIFINKTWSVIFEKYLVPMMSVLTVGHVAVAFSYFFDLEKKDCDCAKGPQEKLMYYISFIQVIVVGGSLLMEIRASR